MACGLVGGGLRLLRPRRRPRRPAATCVVRVAGDGVEGAQLVDELVGRAAGEQHVEPASSAVAGVGGAGQLPDLAVEGVELRLGVGGGLVGAGDGGLLLLELRPWPR